MVRQLGEGQHGYYSSQEKDVVREKYDLPLIEAAARQKGGQIRYFGLPGVEALDLRCWGHLCEYVAAVEVFAEAFRELKHKLSTQFGNIQHRAHLGDVDKVILKNGDPGPPTTFVSTTDKPDIGYIWDFDVIYLDYFGKFLPYNRGGRVVKNRANALRRLFASDRQDSWQPWLLILTVESKLYGSRDREQMRQFLSDSGANADNQTGSVIDFLLEEDGVPDAEQAARLVHGTLGHIVATAASNTDVAISPRPTVLYRGARSAPMLHFAYEVTPVELLSGSQHVLPLIRAPLIQVQVKSIEDEPWFKLLSAQPPGQTELSLKDALDFLDEKQVAKILKG